MQISIGRFFEGLVLQLAQIAVLKVLSILWSGLLRRNRKLLATRIVRRLRRHHKSHQEEQRRRRQPADHENHALKAEAIA